MDEINVCAVKDKDLARFNSGADFRVMRNTLFGSLTHTIGEWGRGAAELQLGVRARNGILSVSCADRPILNGKVVEPKVSVRL